MERYKKKPIVIEAERWFEVTYDREAGHAIGGHASPVYHLDVGYYRHPDVDGSVKCEHCGVPMRLHGWIDTLEGGHNVCPGDWIIQGVMGEMYPCKDVIFKMTYEKYEAIVETLEILNDDDCMAGIRKSMEQINNGDYIPLSELYPMKTSTFGMGIANVNSHMDGEVNIIDGAEFHHFSVTPTQIKGEWSLPWHMVEDDIIAKDSLTGKYD